MTSETSGMSETNASDTSSTSSVGTLTRLATDLSSYNSDGRYIVHVVPSRLKTEAEHRLK